jgi:hypothetical protein
MKRKFRNERTWVSGIVLSLLLLFSACENESGPPAGHGDETDILSMAGALHNQMISYYYDHRTDADESAETFFMETLDLSSEFLVAEGYPVASIEKTRLAIEEQYSPGFMKSTSGGRYSLEPGTFIPQLRATGLYSEHFLQAMAEILQLAENKFNKQTIRQHVNSKFQGISFADPKDRDGQQLFISIFNGSYQFWDSYGSSNLKDVALKPSSWVIINDGIGGLLGMVFGPAGSIITATVFSVGTNEEINR